MRRKTAAVVGWGLGLALALLAGCGSPQGEAGGSTGASSDLDTRRVELTKQTVTLGALADTHVVATTPGTSYGSSPTLEVDLSPESQAYFKFSVPDLEGRVMAARLRLYALDGSADGPTVYDPPGAGDWNEADTWNTRPDCCESWAVASAGAVASGTWLERGDGLGPVLLRAPAGQLGRHGLRLQGGGGEGPPLRRAPAGRAVHGHGGSARSAGWPHQLMT